MSTKSTFEVFCTLGQPIHKPSHQGIVKPTAATYTRKKNTGARISKGQLIEWSSRGGTSRTGAVCRQHAINCLFRIYANQRHQCYRRSWTRPMPVTDNNLSRCFMVDTCKPHQVNMIGVALEDFHPHAQCPKAIIVLNDNFNKWMKHDRIGAWIGANKFRKLDFHLRWLN